MSSFTAESLQTVGGTVTAWLPIPTPGRSIGACSSQIYAQRDGGSLIAFDPLYGESIVPSAIPCLPTEVTSSWFQSNSATTTVLGPTFVCPGAYSAVETILTNSLTEQILCCPSSYSLNTLITGKGNFPSQCTSLLTVGQTLTYESSTPGGPWGIATSTVPASTAESTGPTVVFGMHVNGFNVITTTTGSTGFITPTTSATTGSSSFITPNGVPSNSSSTTSEPSPTSVSAPVHSSSSLSNGAAAGIGAGVACVAIAALIAAWFLFRRLRQRKREMQDQRYQIPVPELMSEGIEPGPYEVDSSRPIQKPRIQTMHELHVDG